MTTSVNQPQPTRENQPTVRVVGTIQKDPEGKTSKSGNLYYDFPITVEDGLGGKTWWNLRMMENLFTKMYEGLIKKHVYCKFVGVGGPREYTKSNGDKGTSNDLLVTGVEMQTGEFIQAERKEPGSEG